MGRRGLRHQVVIIAMLFFEYIIIFVFAESVQCMLMICDNQISVSKSHSIYVRFVRERNKIKHKNTSAGPNQNPKSKVTNIENFESTEFPPRN